MIPSPADIVRTRLLVCAGLRIAGACCGLIAMFPLLSWLGEGLRDGDLMDLDYYFDRIAWVVMLVVVALGVIALAPWLGRVLVPCRLDPRCPSCRYLLLGLSGASRCPECALPLTPEMVDFPASVEEERLRRLVRRGALGAAPRWAGLTLVALSVAIIVATSVEAALSDYGAGGLVPQYVTAVVIAIPGVALSALSARMRRDGRVALGLLSARGTDGGRAEQPLA